MAPPKVGFRTISTRRVGAGQKSLVRQPNISLSHSHTISSLSYSCRNGRRYFRRNDIGGAISRYKENYDGLRESEKERMCEKDRDIRLTNERLFAWSYSPGRNRPKTRFRKRYFNFFVKLVRVCECVKYARVSCSLVCVETACLTTNTNAICSIRRIRVRERWHEQYSNACEWDGAIMNDERKTMRLILLAW